MDARYHSPGFVWELVFPNLAFLPPAVLTFKTLFFCPPNSERISDFRLDRRFHKT